jgi:hypothetical protein
LVCSTPDISALKAGGDAPLASAQRVASCGALGYAQALYQTANEPLAPIADLQTVRHWHGSEPLEVRELEHDGVVALGS